VRWEACTLADWDMGATVEELGRRPLGMKMTTRWRFLLLGEHGGGGGGSLTTSRGQRGGGPSHKLRRTACRYLGTEGVGLDVCVSTTLYS
jgi:hypothetical protein